MRRTLLLLNTMMLALLLASGVALLGATEPVGAAEPQGVLDAACPENPVGAGGFGDLPGVIDGGVPWSQTFTAVRTGELTSAQVLIRDNSPGSQVGDVVIQIRAVDASGAPTNTVLASTVVPASELVPNFPPPPLVITVTANFGLDGAASVVAGQRYALYVTTSATPDFYSVEINASNPCEGTLYYETGEGFVNAGPIGIPSNPEGDLIFFTYVTRRLENTPPKVISTFPKANVDEVSPTANVRASFSEEMRPASVLNAFKLFKKGSTNQIDAQVSYDAAADMATLNPDNNLRRGATYKAVVTTVAKDMAGNRLDQDDSTAGLQQKVWFFEID
jgi:Bacterial Ig-like domain